MRVWIDAQLPPSLSVWLSSRFAVEALTVQELGLRAGKDAEIFFAARDAGAVIVTKDADFLRLLEQHGPPPHVVWITSGNTSNARLRALLESAWPRAQALIEQGEALVELRARQE